MHRTPHMLYASGSIHTVSATQAVPLAPRMHLPSAQPTRTPSCICDCMRQPVHNVCHLVLCLPKLPSTVSWLPDHT